MEKFARIASFSICKPIDRLHIGEDSALGKMIFITGIPTRNKRHFQHVVDRKCELVIGQRVGIPPRKFIDCCGGVYIGDYTIIAGLWTQILTHGIDIYHSRQDAKPVKIGKYCFVGTGCTILAGAALPDYSVLGGGAVLNKAYYEGGWLYAGNPAQPKKRLDPIVIPWMSRTTLGVD
jgi:acetyltransferase-like isoleucine patch superfamily enzyme